MFYRNVPTGPICSICAEEIPEGETCFKFPDEVYVCKGCRAKNIRRARTALNIEFSHILEETTSDFVTTATQTGTKREWVDEYDV